MNKMIQSKKMVRFEDECTKIISAAAKVVPEQLRRETQKKQEKFKKVKKEIENELAKVNERLSYVGDLIRKNSETDEQQDGVLL